MLATGKNNSALIKEASFAIDGIYNRNPKLIKVQRIRDYGVFTHRWSNVTPTTQFLFLKHKEDHGRKSEWIVRPGEML